MGSFIINLAINLAFFNFSELFLWYFYEFLSSFRYRQVKIWGKKNKNVKETYPGNSSPFYVVVYRIRKNITYNPLQITDMDMYISYIIVGFSGYYF